MGLLQVNTLVGLSNFELPLVNHPRNASESLSKSAIMLVFAESRKRKSIHTERVYIDMLL